MTWSEDFSGIPAPSLRAFSCAHAQVAAGSAVELDSAGYVNMTCNAKGAQFVGYSTHQ